MELYFPLFLAQQNSRPPFLIDDRYYVMYNKRRPRKDNRDPERITLVKLRNFLLCDCLKLYSRSKIEKKQNFIQQQISPIIFLFMRFTFYAVQLFVIYCLIIIFFVCQFLPRFSLREFSLRGIPCNVCRCLCVSVCLL